MKALAGLLGLWLAATGWPAGATDSETAEPAPPAQALESERAEKLGRLEAIDQDAESVRKALEKLEADLAGLREEEGRLTQALERSRERRAELDRRVAGSEDRLSRLRERREAIGRSLASRRAVLAEVLAALQRIGRDPPPALLVSPDDALSSVRSAILLGAVVPEIRTETDALVRDLEELAQLRSSIATERSELQAALAENEAESERLSALVIEKVALQQESERRLATERERASTLDETSAELETVIAALETEIGRQREAALAAQRAEEERRQRVAAQLERARQLALAKLPEKNRIAPAYAFSALKGTLVRPVAGEAVRYFGAADGSGNGLTGEILAAEKGSVVTAPVDGWIAFAGPFRSYGQTVIIDAGDDYHLVLAGMEAIAVSEGQFVLSGEPLATMGEAQIGNAALTLASDRPTLYIEFRKGGKPVDPRPWWNDAASSGRASNDT